MDQPAHRVLPNYLGGSIANLMRTVLDACGGGRLSENLVPPLAAGYGLSARELVDKRNIVLLVVDGMGFDVLARNGRGALCSRTAHRLTSVFPSTTAAAIPTFMTGLTPAQHALTGWHMWLDELQAVTAILPLTPRNAPPFPVQPDKLTQQLFDHRPIYPQLDRAAWVLTPEYIAHSPFNLFHTQGATLRAYADLPMLMQSLAALLKMPERKFVYAYWPSLDSVLHRYGTDSVEGRTTLGRFCDVLDVLLTDCAGTDTSLLVTADHGFIDSPVDKCIELGEHPPLANMLARPLCGEQRVAWCYLKPGVSIGAFTRCVEAQLGEHSEVIPRERLLAEAWLGPGVPHPKLAARIGDCALLMRDNWTIKDWLPDEPRYRLLGQHGGVSPSEMWVPLVHLEV